MKVTTQKKKRSRPCPDCGSGLIRRTSAQLTPLIMQTLLICKNPVCGASFSGLDEITHRVSPPSEINPNIKLQVTSNEERKEIFKSLTAEGDDHDADSE